MQEQVKMNADENQIVVYQPNETVRLDVRLENETVWLNRHQMAQLFGRDVKTIGKHIANALNEELSDLSDTEPPHDDCSSAVVAKSATIRKGNVFPTVANFATVQNEGGRRTPYLRRRKNGTRNHPRTSRLNPQGDNGTPRIRQV